MSRPLSKARAAFLAGMLGESVRMLLFHIEEATTGDESIRDICASRAGYYTQAAAHFGRLLIAGRGVHDPNDKNCECADCIERGGAEVTRVH